MTLLDRAFAAAYDPLLRSAERAGLAELRRELLAHLAGHVVEIGAGTGANVPHIGGEVTRLTLCEPSPPMADRLRARLGGSATLAEVVAAPAEALPFDDGSVDVVLSTLVLCTVDDLERTLDELARVLRPGGQLRLLEHVHGTGRTATLQRAVARPWRVVGRGCHLTRDPRAALAARGWDVSEVRDVQLPLPAPARPGQVGVARPPLTAPAG
jgi:SAM-dependent methyltransferase